MIVLVAALAGAAPVQCDPIAAAQLLSEARIDEHRAPLSHPELIPGLARASSRTDAALREALDELCAAGEGLSLAPAESWSEAGWDARSFLVTRGETRGCTLYQRQIVVSVATSAGTAPSYRLVARRPITLTPIGDCATAPRWREEELLAGERSPVRLVLATERSDQELVHSEVLVRHATAAGWVEQVIAEPAPDHLLGGDSGPDFTLAETPDGVWVVATGDRRMDANGCTARPGQRVWTWEVDRWIPHEERDALGLLARHGLYRLAGEDGWMALLAQDMEDQERRVARRLSRLERRWTEPLVVLPSAWFPDLNPGFLVVTPAPWPTAEGARTALRGWRWGPAYVKRAWRAEDPCAD